jgi:hypothetical protein
VEKMKRNFLHYSCPKCGAKVHKKGLCSTCLLRPNIGVYNIKTPIKRMVKVIK